LGPTMWAVMVVLEQELVAAALVLAAELRPHWVI